MTWYFGFPEWASAGPQNMADKSSIPITFLIIVAGV